MEKILIFVVNCLVAALLLIGIGYCNFTIHEDDWRPKSECDISWNELQYLLKQKEKGYDVDDRLEKAGINPNPTEEEKQRAKIEATESFNRARNFGTSNEIRLQEMLDAAEHSQNVSDAINEYAITGKRPAMTKKVERDFNRHLEDEKIHRYNTMGFFEKVKMGLDRLF